MKAIESKILAWARQNHFDLSRFSGVTSWKDAEMIKNAIVRETREAARRSLPYTT